MIVTIGNIPVYNAIVADDDCGMYAISLVDDPAVMSKWQAFANQQPVRMYFVSDEEKRRVLGVVMRADFPIYRRDERMGEYYVVYRAEQIRKMAEKYLADGKQNAVDRNHDEVYIEGVQMVQYFIKDSAKGIAPDGFDDISDGSLFAEFHITDDDVWEQVKGGTYVGFSLEGVFDLVPETDAVQVAKDVDAVDGKFKRLLSNLTKNNMSKMQRFKAALAKMLVEFGNVTTDKGILAWDGDDDLAVGVKVFIEDEEGNRSDVEDGDYTTAEGVIYRVAAGEIAEIVEPEAKVEEAPADEAPAAEAEPAAEEKKFGRIVTDAAELIWEGEEDLKAGDAVFVEGEDGELVAAGDGDYKTEDGKVIKVAEGKVSEIVDAEAEVGPDAEALKAENEALKAENEELRKQVETLSKQPLADPAHEQVTVSAEIGKTGNRKLDNLARILRAK